MKTCFSKRLFFSAIDGFIFPMNIDEIDEKNNVADVKPDRPVNPRDPQKELIRVLPGFVCFYTFMCIPLNNL